MIIVVQGISWVYGTLWKVFLRRDGVFLLKHSTPVFCTLSLPVIWIIIVGCFSQQSSPYIYSIGFVNISNQRIREAVVTYPKERFYEPLLLPGEVSGTEGGIRGPFPDVLHVKWMTENGNLHSKEFFPKKNTPAGTKFCDLQIRFIRNGEARLIYLVTKKDDSEDILDLEETSLERASQIKVDMLIEAVEKGNLQAVQELLNQGAEIHGKYRGYAISPLEKAAAKNKLQIAEYLLERNAPIGKSLVIASENSGPEMLQLLVKNGADVNFVPDFAVSPLERAVNAKKTENVKWLLEHGANASR